MNPAALALAQLQQRRAWLARQVAERHRTEVEAEAQLLPWLHVALLAGADVPRFEDRHGKPVPIPTGPALAPELQTAALRTLAQARSAALDVSLTKPAQSDQAKALIALAEALGCPPYPLVAWKEAA